MPTPLQSLRSCSRHAFSPLPASRHLAAASCAAAIVRWRLASSCSSLVPCLDCAIAEAETVKARATAIENTDFMLPPVTLERTTLACSGQAEAGGPCERKGGACATRGALVEKDG